MASTNPSQIIAEDDDVMVFSCSSYTGNSGPCFDAMKTLIPSLIDAEHFEFDWEAAVREIDVVCQSSLPSTSLPVDATPFAPSSNFAENSNSFPSSRGKKKSRTSRQCTLLQFMETSNGISLTEKQDVGEPDQFGLSNDESASRINIDSEAAKTWIYPVNVPLRDYQLAISKAALFSNTLVALPTGLGKTLIAAVVMFNYFRWFPEGKIVFAAPSRPLVMQQIEACHNIVGIPQEWTTDMTGQISPAKRACLWKTKRVFFVTPQVLEKDIQSGSCLVKYLVCLVIDEAHRALGNYSYCVAVRELMALNIPIRILALTATPGSKQQTIQQIIDNLYISTLEYRNESDHDVSPYIHDRKTELIQVPMGQDATEINNMLLEVIRPFILWLCSVGVLHNREYQTLSPCDLLNSRDKFRQAPPIDLPHNKYQDVEGYFGVLITLYHIRKLLSSHGIRPALEMLEEKLRQGSFARFMSKNENICKAKLIMQNNLSNGAPSPKLSKMLDVLLDHFKTKDPQDSRVIIFSNFRGSVRDIMDTLMKLGDVVRATQFVGQSSRKSLKGQSQKDQQAVLEKFRAGGYNVIVATSIGEEGLDIMEVDLVICFDANVSPLRMIQRMGRTGRKHDGRVVVLACEGSELKGYMRKQGNSRAIKKHMRNGGINSFNFHPSPRMIPHIFKPGVQYVELSIEKYVRPGKKPKDIAMPTPLMKRKLTVTEAELVDKYFHTTNEAFQKPSLTAFPHFQTYPSKINKVMHSHRTGILIDMMQHLQRLYFSRDINSFVAEEILCIGNDLKATNAEESNENVVEVNNAGECNGSIKDSLGANKASKAAPYSQVLQSEVSTSVKLTPMSMLGMTTPRENYDEPFIENKSHDTVQHLQTRCIGNNSFPDPASCSSDIQEKKTGSENVHEMSRCKKNLFDKGDDELTDLMEIKAPLLLANDLDDDATQIELSPRLTNLVQCGIVPESPIDDGGFTERKKRNGFVIDAGQVDGELYSKCCPEANESVVMDDNGCVQKASASPANSALQTPLLKKNNSSCFRTCDDSSPFARVTETPLAMLANRSSGSDWRLAAEEMPESVKPPHKFKRLRKVGDCGKFINREGIKEAAPAPKLNLLMSFSTGRRIQNKNYTGKRRPANDARIFIEEEAEVSSEPSSSTDEQDGQYEDSCDSFIDDRITATAGSAETGCVDMMAIYRRSLLSQSPGMLLKYSASVSVSGTPSRISENESSSGKTQHSIDAAHIDSLNRSTAMNLEPFGSNQSSKAIVSATSACPREEEGKIEKQNRNLVFGESGFLPTINLETKFFHCSEVTEGAPIDIYHGSEDVSKDDEFYEDLDLDAVEAQATLLLKQKFDLPSQNRSPKLQHQNLNAIICSPSFDLGI